MSESIEMWVAACVDCDGHIGLYKSGVAITFSQNEDGVELVETYERRVNSLGIKTSRRLAQHSSYKTPQYSIAITCEGKLASWKNKLLFLQLIAPHLVRKRKRAKQGIQICKQKVKYYTQRIVERERKGKAAETLLLKLLAQRGGQKTHELSRKCAQAELVRGKRCQLILLNLKRRNLVRCDFSENPMKTLWYLA